MTLQPNSNPEHSRGEGGSMSNARALGESGRDRTPLTEQEINAFQTLRTAFEREREPELRAAIEFLKSRNNREQVGAQLLVNLTSGGASSKLASAEALQGTDLGEIREAMLRMLAIPVDTPESDPPLHRRRHTEPPPQLLAAIALAKDHSGQVTLLMNKQFSNSPLYFVDLRHRTHYTFDRDFFDQTVLDYLAVLLDPRSDSFFKDRITLALQHDFRERVPYGLRQKLEVGLEGNYFTALVNALKGDLQFVVEASHNTGSLSHLGAEVDRQRAVALERGSSIKALLSAPGGVWHLRHLPIDERVRIAGILLFAENGGNPRHLEKNFLLELFLAPLASGITRTEAGIFLRPLIETDADTRSAFLEVASASELSRIEQDPFRASSKVILFARECLAKACNRSV